MSEDRNHAQPQADDARAPTFEQAVDQLEQIIDAIETGQIGIEQALDRYEQGVKLLNHCRGILDRAEQKIEQLRVNEEGELEEAPDDE